MIALTLWTIMELAVSDVPLGYTLIKAISSLAFFLVAIYALTPHF
jgi:hypothetical protein